MRNILNYLLLALLFALTVIVIGNNADTSGKKEQAFSAGITADTNANRGANRTEEIGTDFYAGKLHETTGEERTKRRERTIGKEESVETLITSIYGEDEFITEEAKRWKEHVDGKVNENNEEWLAYIVIQSWITKKKSGKDYKWENFRKDISGDIRYKWSCQKILKDHAVFSSLSKPKAKTDKTVLLKPRIANTKQISVARKKAEKMPQGKEVTFTDVGEYWDTGKELIALEQGYPSWEAYERKVGKENAKAIFRERTNIMTTRGRLVLTRRQ